MKSQLQGWAHLEVWSLRAKPPYAVKQSLFDSQLYYLLMMKLLTALSSLCLSFPTYHADVLNRVMWKSIRKEPRRESICVNIKVFHTLNGRAVLLPISYLVLGSLPDFCSQHRGTKTAFQVPFKTNVSSLMQLSLYIFVIILVLFCFIMGGRSSHTQQITAFPGLFIE